MTLPTDKSRYVQDPAKTYLTATNDNGTPMYMAPEQFNGSHLDEKVDVYALGCILNECLTRRQPWRNMPNFFQVWALFSAFYSVA